MPKVTMWVDITVELEGEYPEMMTEFKDMEQFLRNKYIEPASIIIAVADKKFKVIDWDWKEKQE